MCGALFIVCGVLGAAFLGLFVDKTKKFIESIKISMCFTSLACTAFAVVRTIRSLVFLGHGCHIVLVWLESKIKFIQKKTSNLRSAVLKPVLRAVQMAYNSYNIETEQNMWS